ncbi:MAG: Omp28-related outer membrane protein [Muribaculaceae bacterium]|nr:Omp28-related outer membrane protein [Muribaculaceae bacterium]
MKTDLIRIISISSAMLLASSAVHAAANASAPSTEIKLGYSAGNLGLNLGYPTRIIVKGAIQFTADEMQRYNGASLTRLNVAMGNNLTEQNNYVFITDNLDGPVLYSQPVDEFQYGWNEIALDTPFEIDGRELFVGFRYESAGETLSLDGEPDNNLANWIYISQTDENGGQWTHQSGGALNIQAIVEGDGLPQHDIAIDRHTIRQYACTTEPVPLWIVVRNLGAATVGSIDVTVAADGEELIVGTVDGLEIPSGEMRNVCIGELQFKSNNIFDLTVDVTAVDGMPDERPADNSVTVANVIVRKDYTPRKVMLEHFSTMNCANCPNAHRAIDDALHFRNDVIHVIHHAGFGVDPLTIQAAEAYMWFYTDGKTNGSSYAPAVMLDRTNMSAYGATDGDHSTPGPAFIPRRENLGSLIDRRLSAPALLTVGINSDYQPADRTLKVSVEGSVPNGSADRLGVDSPRLTIMLTEDGIPGPQVGVTVPMDGPYIHDRVLRHVMTGSVWGDVVEFNGGDYKSKEYTYTIPETWNPENIRIVAFVSGFDQTSSNSCQILNAEEIMLDSNVGIPSLPVAATWVPAVRNGAVTLPQDCLGARVHSLSGALIASVPAGAPSIGLGSLPAGVYILSADMPGGTVTSKIVR